MLVRPGGHGRRVTVELADRLVRVARGEPVRQPLAIHGTNTSSRTGWIDVGRRKTEPRGEEGSSGAPERRRRRRGPRPGVGRACRGRAERERGRAPGRLALARVPTPAPSTGSGPTRHTLFQFQRNRDPRDGKVGMATTASSASSALRCSVSGSSHAGGRWDVTSLEFPASATYGVSREAVDATFRCRDRGRAQAVPAGARADSRDGIAGARTFRRARAARPGTAPPRVAGRPPRPTGRGF